MMKKNILVLSFIGLFALSCNHSNKDADQAALVGDSDTAVVDMHNSENSVDWDGTYKSIQPCADCEGIEVVLTLNSDLTFTRKTTYLGSKAAGITPTEEKGKFEFYDSGSKIKLDIASNSGPNKYIVGENLVVQLDMEGAEIKGAHSDFYVMKKE